MRRLGIPAIDNFIDGLALKGIERHRVYTKEREVDLAEAENELRRHNAHPDIWGPKRIHEDKKEVERCKEKATKARAQMDRLDAAVAARDARRRGAA